MKELVKEINIRLQQVTDRLAALDKECTQLIEEQGNLQQLAKLYNSMEYDPITEERRVTETMLHMEKKPHTGGRRKGVSQYDEAVEIIFTSLKNPLELTTIKKELSTILNIKVDKFLVDYILRQQIRNNHIKRIAQGCYTWIGDAKNADTSTLPAGGCPETEKS